MKSLTPASDDFGCQPVSVIERNGGREDFSLAKLERSIGIAAKSRADNDYVRVLASRIGADVVLKLRGQAIVRSQQIAGQAPCGLLKTDDIAYLRYASITKRYRSRWDFRIEILAVLGAQAAD